MAFASRVGVYRSTIRSVQTDESGNSSLSDRSCCVRHFQPDTRSEVGRKNHRQSKLIAEAECKVQFLQMRRLTIGDDGTSSATE